MIVFDVSFLIPPLHKKGKPMVCISCFDISVMIFIFNLASCYVKMQNGAIIILTISNFELDNRYH